MKTTYMLGAGASHGYTSPTGVPPPLATGLFAAYPRLAISGDIEVKIGTLLGYVRDRYGVPFEKYMDFDMDAEEFMTTLRDDINRARAARPRTRPEKEQLFALRRSLGAAYTQTLFVFAHILNEICNGPESTDYRNLVARAGADDRFITFNWDTLLDRVLSSMFGWSPDTGYGVHFDRVMDDGWRETDWKRESPRLMKLHGSTNWIVRWVSFDHTGQRRMLVNDPSVKNLSLHTEAYFRGKHLGDVGVVSNLGHVKYRSSLDQMDTHISAVPVSDSLMRPYLFVRGSVRFNTFRDRWRPDYAPYTYFYPPDIPDGAIPSLPLLVAPTRQKEYDVFGSVLQPIWDEAEVALRESDRLVIIGYSFPPTDLRARDLVSDFTGMIEVVNPSPSSVIDALRASRIPEENISVFEGTMADYNSR